MVNSGMIRVENRTWVTFDHPQSRTLLAGETVHFVDYIASRGVSAAVSVLPAFRKIIQEEKPDLVISTGAAIAVPAAIAAKLRRVPFTYIESVSRFDGPSLSGKLVRLIPGTDLYTQHPSWSSRKWKVGPNVLGNYESKPYAGNSVQRVFISLGTIKPYRFDRAINALSKIIPDTVTVRLQYGSTTGTYGHWEATESIEGDKFKENLQWADAVILHAGVGSALNSLDQGKIPLLLVRDSARHEHVDNHQEQIARCLVDLGLAHCPSLEDITWEDIQSVAQRRVTRKNF